MKLSFLIACLLFAAPISAQTIVSPQEFESLSTGKTMYFSRDGQFYGAEQFYTRRRSLWQYNDDTCANGRWFDKGDMICFEYDENPDVQCWHFLKKSDGYAARAEGSTVEFDLDLFKIDEKPLECLGPSIGA